MMSALFLACVAWAIFLFVLTVFFDIWVYIVTKDFGFVLRAWRSRHKTPDPCLLPKQAMLLKSISLLERGLGYFGLFVIIPLYIFILII